MRLTFCFLFFFISSISYTQVEDGVWHQSIEPEQLQSDFDILVSTLADIHPAIYQYTPKEDLHKVELAIREQLNSPMSDMAFHILVRQYIKDIKCGHTMARPSQDWYDFQGENPSRIPLDVYLIEDKIFVKHVYQEGKNIPIGAEIISIDGKMSSEILQDMYAIQERDGLGLTFRDVKIERIFKTFYLMLYGKSDNHVIHFSSQNVLGTESLTAGVFDRLPKKHERDSSLYDIQFSTRGGNFFLYGADSIPVLDLNTFYRKDFKKFYKMMFKELALSGSEYLVIDLRGNGGGFFPHGALLLKYLMNENFTFDFYRKEDKPKKNKNLKMPFSNKMTKIVFGSIPDSDKSNPRRDYQIRYKIKKKNHFDGLLFVLTDGGSFSMGSLVTAKLKDGRNATIIGEETGGAEEGSNAVLTGVLTLPFSGIRVVVPYYHFNHRVIEEKVGRGVLPKVEVNYSVDDMINQTDKEMLEIAKILNTL